MMPKPTGQRTLPASLRNRAIGVCGLGLIGGSIVQRLAQSRPQLTLFASDSAPSLRRAVASYATWSPTLAELAERCDIVILAMPVPGIVKALGEIAQHLHGQNRARRLLVLDTGTIKQPILAAALRHRTRFDFVGMHPLAGSEHPGWNHADANLFEGRRVVLCSDHSEGVTTAKAIVSALGGKAITMNAVQHDRAVARSIGLPHLLAFAAQGMNSSDVSELAGRSWASLTRVAASDPAMVAGFLHGNRRNLQRALRRLQSQISLMERALAQKSDTHLRALLTKWQRH